MFPQLAEELEPKPEVRDHYIGAEILLPRGDQMVRCHVVARSQDVNGNVMERSHENPVLDIRTYQGGKVTEITANVIAKSMHAQCNADGISAYSWMC